MAKHAKMKKSDSSSGLMIDRLREVSLISIVGIAVFMLIALLSYHQSDPGWSHIATGYVVQNAAGNLGAWFADVMLLIFGYVAYIFPLLLVSLVIRYYCDSKTLEMDNSLLFALLRFIGFVAILISLCALTSLFLPYHLTLSYNNGGIIGESLAGFMQGYFQLIGSSVILICILICSTTVATGISWLAMCEKIGWFVYSIIKKIFETLYFINWREGFYQLTRSVGKTSQRSLSFVRNLMPSKDFEKALISAPAVHVKEIVQLPDVSLEDEKSFGVKPKPSFGKLSEETAKSRRFKATQKGLPSLGLLDTPEVLGQEKINLNILKLKSKEVELRLADFGIEASVDAVYPGPVVTRYEINLAAGTKVNKISNLAKDLARSLSAVSVRVVEVIPGKSVIGLELPNEIRHMVSLQDILAADAFKTSHAALPLGLGKDIAGHPVVVDLSKMPHLLVAGTTGSGKSVCLNALLMSLLYRCSHEDLRLILIDPKMLELAVYDDIPHLLTPVVTDMKKAATALRWCVVEMEKRYCLMSALGVRNIAGYNAKIKAAKDRGEPLLDPLIDEGVATELEPLSRIVVVADEFADMMMVVGKKIETLISRIAQKARAAGIHLILATQRPSVDVITGLIKANIPTRIAFQVSSKIDSRTIIDQQGAEQLLGHGDMLYLPPGSGLPVRIHGAYVSDDEVHRVVSFIKKTGMPEYLDEITNDDIAKQNMGADSSQSDWLTDNSDQDELYDHAVFLITKNRRVSVSSIQRHFKIGYNRASRIVEAMEKDGIVSAMEGNGNREVLAPPPVE